MEQLLLMTDINLSQNRLRYLDDCNMLQCARKICVDNNRLDSIVRQGTLNLPCLEELSLNNNSILLNISFGKRPSNAPPPLKCIMTYDRNLRPIPITFCKIVFP